MKVTGAPLIYCSKPMPGMLGVLLYGPNTLLIQECIAALRKHFLPEDDNAMAHVTVTSDMLKQNPLILADELSSFGFFATKKLIHIKDADDSFLKPLQSALSLPDAGHVLIMEAAELGPKSGLRGWAEKATDIAALACYMMEGQALHRFVQDRFKEKGAIISGEGIILLIDRLGNEIASLSNVINQLIDYAGHDATIHVEHVEALLIDQAEQGLDKLVQAFADGTLPQMDRVLYQLHAEGVSMVAVLRMLQTYFYRLRLVQAEIKNGLSFEDSVKRLRPPIFFKAKPAFSKHLRRWDMIRLDQALIEFQKLEAACKKTGTPELELVQQRLIALVA